jgi:hypothetical protein
MKNPLDLLQSWMHNAQAALFPEPPALKQGDHTSLSKTSTLRITEVPSPWKVGENGLKEAKNLISRWKANGAKTSEVKTVLDQLVTFADEIYCKPPKPAARSSKRLKTKKSAKKQPAYQYFNGVSLQNAATNKWIH